MKWRVPNLAHAEVVRFLREHLACEEAMTWVTVTMAGADLRTLIAACPSDGWMSWFVTEMFGYLVYCMLDDAWVDDVRWIDFVRECLEVVD